MFGSQPVGHLPLPHLGISYYSLSGPGAIQVNVLTVFSILYKKYQRNTDGYYSLKRP